MGYEEALVRITAGLLVLLGFYKAIKEAHTAWRSPAIEVKEDVEKKLERDFVGITELKKENKEIKAELKELRETVAKLLSIQSDTQNDIKMVTRTQFLLLQHEVTGNHNVDMQKLLIEFGEYLNEN
mgnify:FL=1